MSWLWPRRLNTDDSIWIRVVRLVHWCIVGVAAFCLIMSYAALIMTGDREPISYIGVALVWIAVAMFARGLRYIAVRE